MKNIIKLILFMLLIPFGLSAQSVIVTNGWTASFASLAGAENVQILAPYEMKHPPEYEISLKEMQMVANADYLIFAGYETMMSRIKEALGDESDVILIQIKTVNSQKIIHESVMKIARVLGTETQAILNLKEVDLFFDLWRSDLIMDEELLNSVVVHFHQQGLAAALGFNPLLVFGPAAPSLSETRTVLNENPMLIIDNYHNPVSASFLEMKEKPTIVQWINFPGSEGTKSLFDVLEYNKNELNKVFH